MTVFVIFVFSADVVSFDGGLIINFSGQKVMTCRKLPKINNTIEPSKTNRARELPGRVDRLSLFFCFHTHQNIHIHLPSAIRMAVNLNREDISFQDLRDERSENGIVEEDERDRALEEKDGGHMGHEDASELGEDDAQDVGEEMESQEVNGAEEERVNDEEVAEKPAETAMEEVTPEDNGDTAIDAVHQVKEGGDEKPGEEAKEVDLEGNKEATSGGVKKVLKSGVFGGKYLERWQYFTYRSYLWSLSSRCSQAYTASKDSCRCFCICPTLPPFSCSR